MQHATKNERQRIEGKLGKLSIDQKDSEKFAIGP